MSKVKESKSGSEVQYENDLALYNPLLEKLLRSRGIETYQEAESFLNPDFDLDLHDPYLLPDMDKAVERILTAVRNKEKILIYSDYDADGIPGGVVLRDFFEKIGHENIENYIPHRHDEGYGLHLEAIETFKENGVNLIITIDCGVSDYAQVARANELGMDVIVTDHHEPKEDPHPALAVVNPKMAHSQYPEQVLCGAGVIFKLIQAILSKERFNLKEGQEKWFLDLVGIATLSDMVPLTGENRALSFYGLKVLQKSPRPGLQKLWQKLRVNQNLLTEDDIAFSLTPRLNAASRMGHPDDAFNLLKTNDHGEAGVLSDHLDKINEERKGVVASLVKEIKKRIHERKSAGELPKVLVLGDPSWRPALLGLAANSLLDDFDHAIFLWGRNGDATLKGSCRGPENVDLTKLMEGVGDALVKYGGHKQAGGFEVLQENVHTLEEKLNEAYKLLPESEVILAENFDAMISIDDVNWDVYRHIERLAPFGVGNPKPVFKIGQVEIESVKQFGKDANHLELSLASPKGTVKAISFFSKPESFSVTPEEGLKANLLATMEKSNFRNFPELRLRIVDII